MYKIMFVDDDKLILRRLHYLLDWHLFGFDIIGSATDGIEALKIIETNVPDIIISDINMPNMHGLQFAEAIKSSHPHVRFIMLTVNDSFACAQQALNIGVCHYLLKPIEKNKLESLIEKIVLEFNNSHLENLHVSDLQDKADISEKMIKDKFLNWVVSGRQVLTDHQLMEKFDFYNIPIKADQFEMISIHINKFEEHVIKENNMDGLLHTVIKCVENTLYEYSNCVVFSDSFYNINILLGSNSNSSDFGQNIKLICQSLRNNLMFQLNLMVTILFSRKYKSYQNIYRCYYDTKYLSKYSQSIMDMGIISFDDFISTSVTYLIDFDAIRSQILKYLRTNDMISLCALIKTSLSPQSQEHQNFEGFNMLRVDHIMTGIMFIQESKADLRDIFGRHFDPLTEVMEKNEPLQCVDFIDDFYKTILAYIHTNKISPSRRVVEKCIELIDQNIAIPILSVKWLASQLYINENYLSRQFHSETNISLIKYIGAKRLEIAKGYLDHGYKNLQTVAKMTGFSDPLYFSKCFKKRFGVAPSKYLETIVSAP